MPFKLKLWHPESSCNTTKNNTLTSPLHRCKQKRLPGQPEASKSRHLTPWQPFTLPVLLPTCWQPPHQSSRLHHVDAAAAWPLADTFQQRHARCSSNGQASGVESDVRGAKLFCWWHSLLLLADVQWHVSAGVQVASADTDLMELTEENVEKVLDEVGGNQGCRSVLVVG